MTDPKKMFDKFDSLGIASLRVEEREKLLRGYAITAGAAFTDPYEALHKSVSEQAMAAALPSAAESMQGQLRPSTLGLVGTDKSAVEKWAEMQKATDEQQERIAMALARNSYVARPAAPNNNILGLDPAIAAHPLNMSEDQMRKVVFGDVYAMPTTAEQIGKMVGIDTTHNPNVLVNQQGAWQHTPLHDPRPYSEVEREDRDRQLSDSTNAAIAHHHRMMRQVAEAREREQQQVEYARRSAEASEASVAALKAALVVEEKRTADALEEAAAAQKEARRARSNTRIALWFAGASMLLTAWSFIKDQF